MAEIQSSSIGEQSYDSDDQVNQAETFLANNEDQNSSETTESPHQKDPNDPHSTDTNRVEETQNKADNEDTVPFVQVVEKTTTAQSSDENQDKANDDTTQDELNDAAHTTTNESTENDTVADAQYKAQENAGNVQDNATELKDEASVTIQDAQDVAKETVQENSNALDDSATQTEIAREGEQGTTEGQAIGEAEPEDHKKSVSEVREETKVAVDAIAAPINTAVTQGMEAAAEAISNAAAATKQFVDDIKAKLAGAANRDQVKTNDETTVVEGENVAVADAPTVATTVDEATTNSLDSNNPVVAQTTATSQPSNAATISTNHAPQEANKTGTAPGLKTVTTAQAATAKSPSKGPISTVRRIFNGLFNSAARPSGDQQKSNPAPQPPAATPVAATNSST